MTQDNFLLSISIAWTAIVAGLLAIWHCRFEDCQRVAISTYDAQ